MYKITKIVFATDMHNAILNEKTAEVVEITLAEDIKKPTIKIGFE